MIRFGLVCAAINGAGYLLWHTEIAHHDNIATATICLHLAVIGLVCSIIMIFCGAARSAS